MTDTNGIAQEWAGRMQLDCPVLGGPLGGDGGAGCAAPGGTPAQRGAEVSDDLERVAVLSVN